MHDYFARVRKEAIIFSAFKLQPIPITDNIIRNIALSNKLSPVRIAPFTPTVKREDSSTTAMEKSTPVLGGGLFINREDVSWWTISFASAQCDHLATSVYVPVIFKKGKFFRLQRIPLTSIPRA